MVSKYLPKIFVSCKRKNSNLNSRNLTKRSRLTTLVIKYIGIVYLLKWYMERDMALLPRYPC